MKFLHRHQVKPIDDESFTIYIVDYVCDISLSAILSELQGSSRCDFLYAAQKANTYMHILSQSYTYFAIFQSRHGFNFKCFPSSDSVSCI